MNIPIEFSIYLASKTRWAHLTKIIELPAVPRVGEFVKLKNEKVGDYFPLKVVDVTYRENNKIEIMTELLENIDGRMYSFEEENEFDEYFSSYIDEGWACERGIGENKRYKGT